MIFRTSTSHEEGCERQFSIETKEFLGDDAGPRRGLLHRATSSGSRTTAAGQTFNEVPGTEKVWPASWCCWRWAFSARRSAARSNSLGLELDPRGNVKCDANYMTSVARRVRRRRHAPRPVARRVGDSRRPRSRPRRRQVPDGRDAPAQRQRRRLRLEMIGLI